MHVRNIIVLTCGTIVLLTGCGPAHGPPKVLLPDPGDMPAQASGRRLFNTPNAFIYAHSDTDAGEADRWVVGVKDYIRRNYRKELDKGVVLVNGPGDEPLARTIEDLYAHENDPSLMTTPPRRSQSPEQVREKLQKEGLSEDAFIRGCSVPLTAARLETMGISMQGATWAMAGPSHALASECGIATIAAGLMKRNPKLTAEQAHDAAARFPDLAAMPFEMARGQPIMILWVQQQKEWTDDQRRTAIIKYLKGQLRKNGLPVPPDNEMGW